MEPCTHDVEGLETGLLRMLGMSNDLCEGLRAGCGPEFAERHLEELLTYARQQFACEEQLLEAVCYPRLAEHCHEHQNMIAWVEEMQTRLGQGTLPAPALEVAEYLRDWIGEHAHHSDQSYLSEFRAGERF